ncbi:MAG: LssY C-terminal domain-containing protein [Arthrobacter sp.]
MLGGTVTKGCETLKADDGGTSRRRPFTGQFDGRPSSAGSSEADPVTLGSSWRIIRAALLHRSYPSAPASPLFVYRTDGDLPIISLGPPRPDAQTVP